MMIGNYKFVHIAVRYWREACLGKLLEYISRLLMSGSHVPRLPAGDPFPAPKMVVWLAKNG